MKKFLLLLTLASPGLLAQTINPNQVRPSSVNGQVLTTVGGASAWANNNLPVTGWSGTLAANQGSSDTTAQVTVSAGAIPTEGAFWLDTEWEHYSGITNTSGSNYTLNNVTRGLYLTTAASHTSGVSVHPASQILAGSNSTNFAWAGGVFGNGNFFSVNCPLATSLNDTSVFNIGCPGTTSGMYWYPNGSFVQHSSGTSTFVASSLAFEDSIYGISDAIDNNYALTKSRYILQTVLPNQVTASTGFGAGIPSQVVAVPAPTAGAPSLYNLFIPSGSTTNTYECTGIDQAGNTIPGTTASITGLASSGWGAPGKVIVFCPPIPGAVQTQVWRTAGVPTAPVLLATNSANPYTYQDGYSSGSAGSPPSSNTTVPVLAVGNTYTAPTYGVIAAASSTPTLTCNSSREGWEYHNTSTGAAPAVYRCVSGSWTGVSSSSGITSINGDTTPAQSIACTGGGISCSTASGTTTINEAGGGLTGTINSATQYQDTQYPSTGTTVGGSANSTTPPTSLTASQMQAVVTAQPASNGNLFLKSAEPPFTNTSSKQVFDMRPGVRPKYFTEYGAACDAKLAYATITIGSPSTITINGSSYSFVASDAGDSGTNLGAKWISIVYPPWVTGGAPERFDTYITAVDSSTVAELHSAPPYTTKSNWMVTIGHDDTAQIATAMTAAKSNGFVLGVPYGGLCWSRTAPVMLQGQSIVGSGLDATGYQGVSPLSGGFLGGAGFDTLQVPDPASATGTASEGQRLSTFNLYYDARLDATKAWNFDNDGTVTAETPLYRPVAKSSMLANNPYGPGWVRGSEPYGLNAYGGVAATTASSNVICVLTGGTPAVGDDIVFGWLPNGVFHTTVASTAGSCGSGTPLTLTDAVPSGDTVAQTDFMYGEAPGSATSGTAVQEIETAIPSTGRVWPMQINLANPVQPEPGSESDVAPWGLVQIGAEQFYYYTSSSYPAHAAGTNWITLTGSVQNGIGSTGDAHSVGDAIVPLNPWQPTWQWPFATINGSGTVTPPNATFFPGLNIGNCGFASPVASGANTVGQTMFYRATFHDINIQAWPYYSENDYEQPTGAHWTANNSTCGMYFGGTIPFNSHFYNLNVAAQYGIMQGTPSTLTHNWASGLNYPTADQTNWDHISINAGIDFDFIGGGTNSWQNFQLFSENQSGIGPFQPSTYSLITQFSYVSGTHTLTVTANNALAVGMTVKIGGLTTGTYLNGTSWTVASTTNTSFTATNSGFSHADVGTTSDTGAAIQTTWGSVGAGFWTSAFDDDSTGNGSGGRYTNSSGCHTGVISNFYLEAETGFYNEKAPMFEMDCIETTWLDTGDISGGPDFVGGSLNRLGQTFVQSAPNLPLVNDGMNNSFALGNGLANQGGGGGYPVGNVWDVNPFLNWNSGTVASAITQTSSGQAAQGAIASSPGQTAETFIGGNTTAPYVNSLSGLILSDKLALSSESGTAIPWTFDGSSANLSNGYVGCLVATTVVPAEYCTAFLNKALGNATVGNQIYAGLNTVTVGIEQLSGSTQNIGLRVNSTTAGCSSLATTFTATGVTTSWKYFNLGTIDLTAFSGCNLQFEVLNSSASSAQFNFNVLDFAPVPTNLTVKQLTTAGTGTAACIQSGAGAPSGAPTQPSGAVCATSSLYMNTSGSIGSLVYTWDGSTWQVVK